MRMFYYMFLKTIFYLFLLSVLMGLVTFSFIIKAILYYIVGGYFIG